MEGERGGGEGGNERRESEEGKRGGREGRESEEGERGGREGRESEEGDSEERRESEEGKREGENSSQICAYKRTLLVFKWQNRQSIFYFMHLINVHTCFAVHTTNV